MDLITEGDRLLKMTALHLIWDLVFELCVDPAYKGVKCMEIGRNDRRISVTCRCSEEELYRLVNAVDVDSSLGLELCDLIVHDQDIETE